jgi:hypothetical protein
METDHQQSASQGKVAFRGEAVVRKNQSLSAFQTSDGTKTRQARNTIVCDRYACYQFIPQQQRTT